MGKSQDEYEHVFKGEATFMKLIASCDFANSTPFDGLTLKFNSSPKSKPDSTGCINIDFAIPRFELNLLPHLFFSIHCSHFLFYRTACSSVQSVLNCATTLIHNQRCIPAAVEKYHSSHSGDVAPWFGGK